MPRLFTPRIPSSRVTRYPRFAYLLLTLSNSPRLPRYRLPPYRLYLIPPRLTPTKAP